MAAQRSSRAARARPPGRRVRERSTTERRRQQDSPSQSSAPIGKPASHIACSHFFRTNRGYPDTAITSERPPARRVAVDGLGSVCFGHAHVADQHAFPLCHVYVRFRDSEAACCGLPDHRGRHITRLAFYVMRRVRDPACVTGARWVQTTTDRRRLPSSRPTSTVSCTPQRLSTSRCSQLLKSTTLVVLRAACRIPPISRRERAQRQNKLDGHFCALHLNAGPG